MKETFKLKGTFFKSNEMWFFLADGDLYPWEQCEPTVWSNTILKQGIHTDNFQTVSQKDDFVNLGLQL